MNFFKIVMIFMSISLSSYGALKYEDVNKNHWAYESIKKLVDNNILKEDVFKFDGNKSLSRYDFAVALANTLDNIETNKASKKELEVLEMLVIEFSNELNDIGFNAEEFRTQLEETREDIENLRSKLKETNRNMKKLEERIKILEKELRI